MKSNRFLMSVAFGLLTMCVVVVPAVAQQGIGRTQQRPFSDWIDAQGTLLRPDGRPIILGWADNPFTTFALTDYSGKLGAWIESHGGPAIGTQVSGNVSERALDDGTALVTVNEDFKNAFSFAQDDRGTIFGYIALELAGHPERAPGLASGHLQLKFVIPYPGAPLQDFILIDRLNSLGFRSNARGPMREEASVPLGTPGECIVSQTGLFSGPGGGATADGYPAEVVAVHVLSGVAAQAPAERMQSAHDTAPRATTSWGRIKALYRNRSSDGAK